MSEYPIDPWLLNQSPSVGYIHELTEDERRVVRISAPTDHDIKVLENSRMDPKWDFLNELMDDE